MTRRWKARTTTIVQDGNAKKWAKPRTKRKIFPVEVRYEEPKVKNG